MGAVSHLLIVIMLYSATYVYLVWQSSMPQAKNCANVMNIRVYMQWNLRIKDTLRAELLSYFRRLSSGGRFIQIAIIISRNYR